MLIVETKSKSVSVFGSTSGIVKAATKDVRPANGDAYISDLVCYARDKLDKENEFVVNQKVDDNKAP